MEIVLGRKLSLDGLRKPFTKAEDLDLGTGRIRVSGDNVAGYCTSIPVSSASHRERYATQARAAYRLNKGWHEFTVWDDWGTRHELAISDDVEGREVAARQVESLRIHKLLPTEVQP